MGARMPHKNMPHKKMRSISALVLRTFLPLLCALSLLFAALVYNLLYDHILRQFDARLIATSAIVGAMIDPADHDALTAEAMHVRDAEALEAGARYRRNVDPMRRIRGALGLTYLYTQVDGGPMDVIYILDSADGDDHTLIGTADRMTAETLAGLRSVAQEQGVYVSPVEYQERWGLLKAAAAPVYGRDGRISATAGADVNVGVVQTATQAILLQSALIGVISILLCLLVTWWILRRVAGPIAQLTQAALRMASGDYRRPEAWRGPVEVMAFREELSQLGARVAEQHALTAQAAARARLGGLAEPMVAAQGADIEAVWLEDDASQLLLWVPTGGRDLAALLGWRAVAGLARRQRGGGANVAQWRQWTAGTRGGVLAWDRREKLLLWLGAEALDLQIDGGDVQLEPDQALLLGDGDGRVIGDGVRFSLAEGGA